MSFYESTEEQNIMSSIQSAKEKWAKTNVSNMPKKEQVLFLRVVSNKYKSKYKHGKSNV